MPTPLEICLEDLDLPEDDERYINCVALPGGKPGLALDRQGVVRWMPDGPAPYGLWVSADDRLMLLRGPGAGPITIHRGGRSVEAPVEQPVVLLDGDRLQLDGRRLQVHVHGFTEEVHPPEPLTGNALARMARAAAAALALGAVVGAGPSARAQPADPGVGTPPPIEVRRRPPKPAPPRRTVSCTVKSMEAVQGKLQIHATCTEKLHVGARGQLLDPKGQPVTHGTVVVKEVQGDCINGEAAGLNKPVKATTIRFHVRRW